VKSEKASFKSVNEYIASFPRDVQKILKQVRATIKAAAPKATEKVSYQIAAFELNSRNLIHYAAWKTHIAIYPIPAGSDAFNKQVAPYADGKGTLKFPLDKPMPLKLITKIVKYRVANNLKNTNKKKY